MIAMKPVVDVESHDRVAWNTLLLLSTCQGQADTVHVQDPDLHAVCTQSHCTHPDMAERPSGGDNRTTQPIWLE